MSLRDKIGFISHIDHGKTCIISHPPRDEGKLLAQVMAIEKLKNEGIEFIVVGSEEGKERIKELQEQLGFNKPEPSMTMVIKDELMKLEEELQAINFRDSGHYKTKTQLKKPHKHEYRLVDSKWICDCGLKCGESSK